MRTLFALILFVVTGTVFLVGCQSHVEQKIIFLKNPQLLKHYELIPVGKVWKDSSSILSKYDKIIVNSVITSKQLEKSTLEKLNLGSLTGLEKSSFLAFTKYTENAFKKAVQKDKRLKLVDKPGKNTLILQLALVKVVPGKPLFGILRNVPIPVGKAAFIITPAAKITGLAVDDMKGSVAIEGELIDSKTGKVVAMFADNRSETPAIINIRAMSTYGTPKKIVDAWAVLFVKALNRKPGAKLDAPASFKLIQL